MHKYRFHGYFGIVQRFYDKIKAARDGEPFKPGHMIFNADAGLDNIWAFFIFCYHVKDWIKHDDNVSEEIQKKVEDFVKGQNCFKFCADICNGIKHLELEEKRTPKSRGQESKKRPKFTNARWIVDSKTSTTKFYFYVETDDGKIEAVDLATQCLEKWKEFFETNFKNN